MADDIAASSEADNSRDVDVAMQRAAQADAANVIASRIRAIDTAALLTKLSTGGKI